MWRVGALPPTFALGYGEVPGYVPPPKSQPKPRKDTKTPTTPTSPVKHVVTTLPKSKTSLSLHSTTSDDTASTKSKSSSHDHDHKTITSSVASSIRLLRRNRNRSTSVSESAPPPVPPLPSPITATPHPNVPPDPSPHRSNSLFQTLSRKPSLLTRTRSRPSLEQRETAAAATSSHPLPNDGTRNPARLDIPTSRDTSSSSTPVMSPTPTATSHPPGVPLMRTDTLDSVISSTIEFASPLALAAKGGTGRYQSTLGQEVEDEGEPVDTSEDWMAQAFGHGVKPKRSGSLSKLAKRLGIDAGDVPLPPMASKTLPPLPRPPRSPARITKHSRRWSISSFASSVNDDNSADNNGLETEPEPEIYQARIGRRALPHFFLGDQDESERTAAMLRADYWPPPRRSKHPQATHGHAHLGLPVDDHAPPQSWYGEWNRGDIRDVISSLRELR